MSPAVASTQGNPMQTTTEAAKAYHQAGINVLPLREHDKRPVSSWQLWQTTPQSDNDITELFPDDHRNVGVIGGEISNNLNVLDFDSRKRFSDIIDANPHFARIASRTPIVRTHRGVHVWLRTPEPVESTRISELDLDIKATGGYVVAPPSLHPSGQPYLFAEGFKDIYTLDSLDELGFLGLRRAENGTQRPQSRVIGLSRRAFNIVRGNYGETATINRSDLDASAVLEMVKNGWTFEQCFELYRRLAGQGTRFHQEGRNAYTYLRLTYSSAVRYYREHMREFDRRVNAALVNVYNMFTGRTRHTDRAVTEAILLIARESGTTELDLSERRVAERAGVSKRTARESINRLPLSLINKAQGYRSNQYRVDALLSQVGISTQHTCEDMGTFDNSGHDAFHRGALGKPGVGILDVLSSAGTYISAREIARAVDASERTVYRKLDRLSRAGILDTDGAKRNRGYALREQVTTDLLDRVARAFGTAGAGERQRRQHERERDRHRRALEHYHNQTNTA